ncbi:DUF1501 domain-containing protein [Nocardioides sp. Soil805]|uniref:DUF1501 domain-containing protein n=1 Tax=Nocardioides sp. Soil805 TaxID=1736416 RepID=UPI00070296A7|nr:DUF1501 domain-containing protein [Nocardioides sp. Soil805]KRF32491.1 hypothetical protein ASG94_18295 [Nocardioides sp. Soil805]
MTTADDCCAEFTRARLSRRTLLGTAAGVAGLSVVYGGAEVRASAAAATPAPSVLVVVSLRGAADGLSLVVPHADPVYYAARPGIAIAAERLLARDGMFGLHPALAPLLPMWESGRLAAVHATGLPAANRSHFSAMEEIEDASAGSATRVGWLNRLIGLDALTSPVQGIGLGSGVVPTSLAGPSPAMAASSLDRLSIPGEEDGHAARRRSSLKTLWGSDRSVLGEAARDTFTAVDILAPVVAGPDTPAGGATYPRGDLGDALAHAARIIRGDVGVQVITVDQGDWDMHTGLGTLEWGKLKDNAATFASALAAFFADIGSFGDKVTVVCLSEFGRRVAENANYGLDHGHGNVMFLAGAGVQGGRYHGSWPGLTNSPDADLTVTTDYRSVLSEVVRSRFGVDSSRVFPGFVGASLGTMA